MQDVDELLGRTMPRRPRSVRKPATPARPWFFSTWARSQVTAYRIGLVLGYLATIYFGVSSFVAGLPAFVVTAPSWWTPIWASVVVVGGFIAAIGAIRAGSEPVTQSVTRFNRIELVGTVMLFLTLGTYAAVLLILGYYFGDTSRSAVGSGFVALGVHPAVRMIWLIFRPKAR